MRIVFIIVSFYFGLDISFLNYEYVCFMLSCFKFKKNLLTQKKEGDVIVSARTNLLNKKNK